MFDKESLLFLSVETLKKIRDDILESLDSSLIETIEQRNMLNVSLKYVQDLIEDILDEMKRD